MPEFKFKFHKDYDWRDYIVSFHAKDKLEAFAIAETIASKFGVNYERISDE